MAERINAVWVISDVAANGEYICTVQAGPDVAVPLDRRQAQRYATTVITVATRAAQDAAVCAQMRAGGVSDEAVAQVVGDLRRDRPAVDGKATGVLRFAPVVSARDGQPYVAVWLSGAQIAQWSVEEALKHAMHVLVVSVGAELDGAYYRLLTGLGVGASDARAREVVEEVGRYRKVAL